MIEVYLRLLLMQQFWETCIRGMTITTTTPFGSTHSGCLYNGFWYSESSQVYRLDCHQYLCSGSGWIQTNEADPYCCEVDGYYYLPGERRYQDDCYEYVCQNGILEKTNKTHPECCSSNWWWSNDMYWYSYSDYIISKGGVGLNATLSNGACSG
ncbi:hypothetical protein SK128_017461 [Halocaridina rubra]|uniref:Uncharacterized protein n=1 Tax=Halocaridina rubra TaxID=373956 RepID=A0AAN8X8S6_HALRR